jgi:hypothetical protein
VIHAIEQHFEGDTYSLWHLFRDEQRTVFERIMNDNYAEMLDVYRQIFEMNFPIMRAMKEMHMPISNALVTPAEFVLTHDIRAVIESDEFDMEDINEKIELAGHLDINPDWEALNMITGKRLIALLDELSDNPEDQELLVTVNQLLDITDAISIELHIWEAQNIYFSIASRKIPEMRKRADKGDSAADSWLSAMKSLQKKLNISGVMNEDS